jgi:hypothetical protein
MDKQQLDELLHDMASLHKPIKNLVEMSFAISPLLIIATHGWGSQSIHSWYLFRVSNNLSDFIYDY